jgi:hypothetical protein
MFMRVSVITVEQSRWFLPPESIVSVEVTLNSDETYIIEKYQLGNFVLIERKPTVQTTYDGAGCPIGRVEIDNNIYMHQFLRGETRWTVANPAAARTFIAELKEGFDKAKVYLTSNGTPVEAMEFSYAD